MFVGNNAHYEFAVSSLARCCVQKAGNSPQGSFVHLDVSAV